MTYNEDDNTVSFGPLTSEQRSNVVALMRQHFDADMMKTCWFGYKSVPKRWNAVAGALLSNHADITSLIGAAHGGSYSNWMIGFGTLNEKPSDEFLVLLRLSI